MLIGLDFLNVLHIPMKPHLALFQVLWESCGMQESDLKFS